MRSFSGYIKLTGPNWIEIDLEVSGIVVIKLIVDMVAETNSPMKRNQLISIAPMFDFNRVNHGEQRHSFSPIIL